MFQADCNPTLRAPVTVPNMKLTASLSDQRRRPLRLDRFASVYAGRPIARLFRGSDGHGIPILMYHSVHAGSAKGHPYYDTNTSPDVFRLQMRYLKDHGYQALDLETAIPALLAGGTANNFVVITFDDGFRDFYTNAYPILEECGFVATVFVVSGFTADDRLALNGNECLTWAEVRELHAAGVRIGSHTVSHPRLRRLTMAGLHDEVGTSKRTLEDKLGDSVTTFSYPFAFPETDEAFTRRLKHALEEHGYRAGVTTVIGTAAQSDDRMILPRLPVNSWDDLDLFRAKLEGGYDWLHPIQYAHKLVKREAHYDPAV